MSKFNIASIALASTSFLHLRDPQAALLYNEDQKPVGITLYSPGTMAFQEAETRNGNKNWDRLKQKGKADLSTAGRLAEQAQDLAAKTVSFDNFEYDEAGGLTGSALFAKLYADPAYIDIVRQVREHLAGIENFTSGSATS